jgi:integral membrane protein
MLKLFKVIAILEGISYLALFGNMLIIKHSNPELYHKILFPLGMTHGVLVSLYFILAIILKFDLKWSWKTFAIISIASFLPFGTFYIDKKYL